MRSTLLTLTALIATIAVSSLAIAEEKKKDPDLERAKEIINKDKETKGPIRVDSEKQRVSVENKDGKGVYVGGESKEKTHNTPAERRVEAGVQIRFGGDKKEAEPKKKDEEKKDTKK